VALRITLHSRCRHAAAFGTWIALAWAPAFAQVSANQETSPATRDKVNEITVDGCLYGAQGNLELVNGDDAFSLRGDTSTLKKYLGDEVMVRGKQEGSRPPLSLVVSGVTLIFKAPQVKLGKAIADPTNWHFQTNESYGVKFALPALSKNSVGGGSVSPNFVSETGTMTLASLPIPEEIYPGTGFVGGNYLLSVNSEINNVESCEKFGAYEPRFLSRSTLGGTRYTELTVGDAAMGTSYEELYFHTFQNGMCYEVAFSFGEVNTANQDFGCRVPRHGDGSRGGGVHAAHNVSAAQRRLFAEALTHCPHRDFVHRVICNSEWGK